MSRNGTTAAAALSTNPVKVTIVKPSENLIEGTVIMAAQKKPRDFTVRQIRETVRAVKEEEWRKKASGNLQQPSR